MLTKKEFTNQVANKLTKLRKEKGISQEELADRAALYRTYVGHLENSRYSPSAYVLYKIIKALKINPQEFFSF